MVKIEQFPSPQPAKNNEYLEFLKNCVYEYEKYNETLVNKEFHYLDEYYPYGYSYAYYPTLEFDYEQTLADLKTSPYFLRCFEEFQWKKLGIFVEHFNGDWRSGQEIHKIVITQRLYQTSNYSKQA